MKLVAVSALGLLLAGCQLTAQQQAQIEPGPLSFPGTSHQTLANADFVILHRGGDDGVRRYEIRSTNPGKNLHDWPIGAEIKAFSRMSAKNGGPTYSLAPGPAAAALPVRGGIDPKECIVDPDLRRVLKSKKPVCYTSEDAGTIAVYTLPD